MHFDFDLSKCGVAVALTAMLTLTACETTGSGTTSSGSFMDTISTAFAGEDESRLTPEERALREDARIFNETVFGGVVTNAAIGAGVGALAAVLSGRPDQALKTAAIGGVAGGVYGAIDGYRTAVQQEAARKEVREIEILVANVEEENARMEQTLQTTQQIIASTERRLAAAEAAAARDQAAVAQLEVERERGRRNVKQLDKLIAGAQERRDEYQAVAVAVAQEGENTTELDEEISQTTLKLQQLERERDLLASRVGSGPLA